MHYDPRTQQSMAERRAGAFPPPPRGQRRSPWMHLLAALLELAGGQAELLRHAERPWSSVTFSGTRHTVWLAFSGADAVASGEAFVDALPEHEFSIPRQIVADATIAAVVHTALPQPRLELEIDLLLLDDC